MESLARFKEDPSRVVLLAPLIFGIHVSEEAPEFVHWFNSLVAQGISQKLFTEVNIAALVITAIVTALLALTRGRPAALLALGWLSFLMFANAIFHLTGTVVHRRYSPGVVTAAALYIPYFIWFLWLVCRRFAVSAVKAIAIMLLVLLC